MSVVRRVGGESLYDRANRTAETQAGVTTATTNGSGDIVVTFAYQTSAVPVVVATIRGATAIGYSIAVRTESINGFTARICDSAGPVASASFSFAWFAVI